MDMSQYMGMFSDEAYEHLQTMNQSLLELENDPSNTDVLGEIFRSAHTLKGMSATMGFNKIAELTHEMENLLDKLRKSEMKATTGIIDILFSSFDTLQLLVEEVTSGQSKDIDIAPAVKNLQEVITGQRKAPAEEPIPSGGGGVAIAYNAYEKEVLLEAGRKGYNGYEATVFLDEGCLLKAARAYMVFRDLDEIGEIIKSIPEVPDIEDEKFDLDFTVTLVTKESAEEVKRIIENITEIDRAEVKPIKLEEERAKPDEERGERKREPTAPQVPMPKEAPSQGPSKRAAVSHTVRVDVGRLDKLMDLVSELVINKAQLMQFSASHGLKELSEIVAIQDRLMNDLHQEVMNVRMVPIEQVFNRFPRMVRDLARDMGKEVELILEGKETELDRTVIDEIGEPLLHLLRNSIDHGIELPSERAKRGKPEKGMIRLSARHEGNYVVIQVSDDGKGMDPQVIGKVAVEKGMVRADELETMSDDEKIALIFRPGFSTSAVVSDVSGRGVGMDVVRNSIESMRGLVELESGVGRGTTVTIKLPLTLAIINALLVKVGDETYAIEIDSIVETVDVTPDQIETVQNREVTLLRGEVLPLLRLQDIYDVPKTNGSDGADISIIVVRNGQRRVGFVVDSLINQTEIVIKSLGKLLNDTYGIAGGAILPDGRVGLIVDVGSLV
jgi:two-component system chemotaxis sensor kinase CheA